MATFEYIACDSKGREKKGIIDSANLFYARQQLRQQSLIPIEIRPLTKKLSIFHGVMQWVYRLQGTRKNLSILFHHLAILIAASVPLEEALSAVAMQQKSELKNTLLRVRNRIVEGCSLNEALRNFPEIFNRLCCAMIAAGEKTGQLDTVLFHVADHFEQQQQIRNKIQQALIYPAVMSFFSIGMIIFLLAFVVPPLIDLLLDAGKILPLSTRCLLYVSHFITENGFFILSFFMLIFLIWKKYRYAENYFRFRGHLLLALPVLGFAIRCVNSARFMRALGILFSAGTPVLDAMHIAAELVTVFPMRHAIQNQIVQVSEGETLKTALTKMGYFSSVSLHLVAAGESSSQLDSMLLRAAMHEETQVSRLIDTTLKLFEPVLVLVMGSLVLFIVLSVLMPIFTLYDLVI